MDKKLEKIIDLKLDASDRDAEHHGLIQYNYGQILRIHGLDLPPAVEIQFSYREKGGVTENRIGTTKDGVTEVQIPDKMLKNNGTTQDYAIWVFVYVTDETSGNTVYRIKLYVDSRPAPGEVGEDPDESHILDEAVNAVNAAADRAEQAEQNAKASAIEAGKYAASASESATAAEKNKKDALREVEEKKQEAIEAIQEQEETSVGKITTHTDDEIQRILNQTAEPKRELEQTITNADASKRELDHSIETAGTSKTALDKSVELAGTAKTELDTSTQKAGEAKTALDGSAKTAGEMQETLSATVKQAGTLDTSLGEKIETGTQLKTDLTVSGEKAVQDIQTAGSEQLGKMQAVAEEFTADREQIATNKKDIGSLKEDLSNKITKFYASNQGETHITDSDNGKIQDMVLYGKSEQKQYKGINLLPPDTNYTEYIEVSIPKGSSVFWATDGSPAPGGNFRFFNEDKTENMWFGVDAGDTSKVLTLSINAKYVQNLTRFVTEFDLSKICLGIGKKPIYEPYTGGIPSPSPDYPQEIKSVVNPTVKVSNGDGTESQTVQLPYTLNAIPVASGGNVTIDGQQYIADRVVEKDGVFGIERNTATDVPVLTKTLRGTPDYKGRFLQEIAFKKIFSELYEPLVNIGYGKTWAVAGNANDKWVFGVNKMHLYIKPPKDLNYSSEDVLNALKDLNIKVYGALSVSIFEPLPEDIQSKLRALSTNYPVTNVSITSDQLDGYTVFNYPISMANGWNYVKQQLGDTRDYIYDMDAKAQDIDIQSAEAYVNSEYAVALTELEV